MLETDDLYLAAYALTRGGGLAAVAVRCTNTRRLAFFHIEGEGLAGVEREFYQGPALVHLPVLRAEVTRLKNLAFEALRQEERRDAHRHEGRAEPVAVGHAHRRARR